MCCRTGHMRQLPRHSDTVCSLSYIAVNIVSKLHFNCEGQTFFLIEACHMHIAYAFKRCCEVALSQYFKIVTIPTLMCSVHDSWVGATFVYTGPWKRVQGALKISMQKNARRKQEFW